MSRPPKSPSLRDAIEAFTQALTREAAPAPRRPRKAKPKDSPPRRFPALPPNATPAPSYNLVANPPPVWKRRRPVATRVPQHTRCLAYGCSKQPPERRMCPKHIALATQLGLDPVNISAHGFALMAREEKARKVPVTPKRRGRPPYAARQSPVDNVDGPSTEAGEAAADRSETSSEPT